MGAQRNPPAMQPLWAISPLSPGKEVGKNPPHELYQTLGRAFAQGKRDQLFPVGKISSDQHSLKHSHLSHLTPSPSLEKGSSWKLSAPQ